jgi:hypothetical protein
MWGKLTEGNNRTKTKLKTDPLELYRFLSMPGSEVTNLVFANDRVVWASCRFIAEEKSRVWVTITRLSEPTPLPGTEYICSVIWTDCKRERCVVTQRQSFTSSLTRDPG